MEGSALPPPHQVGRIRYTVAAIILGCAGSLAGLAAFGKGTYRIGPLIVEMSVRPATSGTTELALRPDVTEIPLGHAEAKTHAGFLAFRGTVVGIFGRPNLPTALTLTGNPERLALFIRDDGQDAIQKFLIKAGLITVAGGTAGGLAVALVGMKVRRLFQGAIAGVVLVGILGLVAWQTYDINKFSSTTFRPERAALLRR